MGRACLRSFAAAIPLLFLTSSAWAGEDAFVGTFDDPRTGGVLVLGRAPSGYAGHIRLGELKAALTAQVEQGILHGSLESMAGPPVVFAARALPGMTGLLEVWTPMGTVQFRRRGSASPRAPRVGTSPGARAPRSAHARGLAGLRLHVMTRGSILSNAQTSAYTTYDLCPGGVFREAGESSFSVGGGREGAWAGGAATSRAVGRWSVGDGRLRMRWADGDVAEHSLDNVQAGRWRYGRTQFAVERGTAVCPS